jgi:hypothetical protein
MQALPPAEARTRSQTPELGCGWIPALAGTKSLKEATDADLKRMRKSAHFLPASPKTKTHSIP